MQLELFTFEEIKECFASTVNLLLKQANDFLKRLDLRFNLVIESFEKCSESYQSFYWSHVTVRR